MKMDFSNAHLTIVVAPIDLRAGFLRLATIAECLLGIPLPRAATSWPSSASSEKSAK